MQENVNTLLWTDDIEKVLDKLRILCLVRSKYHKNNYFKMLNLLKYFRIPIIILSGINSVFNVALTNFMNQLELSLLCCFISLVAGLIGSIELFLQIQKNMEIDLLNAKEFYLIAIDISKILDLDKVNRHYNPHEYYNEKFTNYSKLVEISIIDKYTHDNLILLNLIENLNEEEKLKIINDTSIETIIKKREELENKKNGISRNKSFRHSIINTLTFNSSNKSNKDGKIYNLQSSNNNSNNNSSNNLESPIKKYNGNICLPNYNIKEQTFENEIEKSPILNIKIDKVDLV